MRFCVFLDTEPDFFGNPWTEILSGVPNLSGYNKPLHKRHTFMCFGSVFGRLLQSCQCKVSFSLLVVARAIACMNEFKANWRVLMTKGEDCSSAALFW